MYQIVDLKQGKGKKKTLQDYINNLNAGSMSGYWSPAGEWHKVHGDCKSSTGGRWTMYL